MPLVVTEDSYQGRWNFLCNGDLISTFITKILMNKHSSNQTPKDRHTDIPLDQGLFDPKDTSDQQYIQKIVTDRYPLEGSDWK